MHHHVHACHREASLRRHHVSHRGQHHGKTHRTRSRTPLSPAQGVRPTHDEQLTVRRSRTRRETCQDKPKATRGTSGARSASESQPEQRQGQRIRRGCTAERFTETKGQCRKGASAVRSVSQGQCRARTEEPAVARRKSVPKVAVSAAETTAGARWSQCSDGAVSRRRDAQRGAERRTRRR